MGSAAGSAVGSGGGSVAASSMMYPPGAAGAGKLGAGTLAFGRVLFVLLAVSNVCRGAVTALRGSAS